MFMVYICAVCCLLGSSIVAGPLKPRATLRGDPVWRFNADQYIVDIAFHELTTSTFAGELKSFKYPAKTVCVLGTWIFYDGIRFESDRYEHPAGGVEFFYAPDYTCFPFTSISGRVFSARFVGSPLDRTADTITLYEGTFFQGDQKLITKDLANTFFGTQSSLIITGKSGWTLYDRPNYEGGSMCIFPPATKTFVPLFLVNMEWHRIPIEHDTIGSVRKGCYSDIRANSGRSIIVDYEPDYEQYEYFL